MLSFSRSAATAIGLTAVWSCCAGFAAESDPSFREVRAIFAAKCLACHGNDPKDLKGDYDLRTRAAAVQGGESGEAAIVPGQPDKSPLFRAIAWADDTLQMPPKENDRLSAEQVAVIRRWIAAGATWDESPATAAASKPGDAWTSGPGGIRIATSGGRSAEWDNRTYAPEAVWAYRPIGRPEVPVVKASGMREHPGSVPSNRGQPDREADASRSPTTVSHPIDAFLLQTLRAKGIDGFAPPADPATLIRRLTFDLTGLPPTALDLDGFLAISPSLPLPVSLSGKDGETERRRDGGKYVDLVQRLLASPHYGEQQARHWLDVVRYADTAGFSNDFERPNSWRYRDYVVRSFNADKPFDRFVIEQIAGDELNADDPEMQIAVGYLRMGPWEHTGMTVAAITRQQYLDDVTNHVGVSLLGQGLRCAACHDHKFDPVPTRDYYRMQAIFSPVQFVEQPLPFLASENVGGFDSAKALVQQRLEQLEAAQVALRKKNRDAVAAFLAENKVKSIDELPADQRPKQDYLGGTFGLTKTDLSVRKIYQKSQAYLERELKRFEPFALSVYSGPPNGYTSIKPLYDTPRQRNGLVPVVHILPGGSLESPADEVTPGVLSAMFRAGGSLATNDSRAIPEATAGRRLALAQWIVSPENSLTARVIVNRVWQQHFGRGLVASPNNFGKMGARPSNPELLDWLATWFIDSGWSLKKLHTLIVTSAAYQQSSERPDLDELRKLDAKNELLAHFPPRRLAAEEIRDAMLAASGELNLELGGPGVFPELNWEVALQPRQIMGSMAPAYVPSRTPAERNRRTLYCFRIRGLSDPLLEVLNRPGSETSCERRDETTVTPQVFALFNSEFAANRALTMAAHLMKARPSDAERIPAAFRAIYGRSPSQAEQQKCSAHFTRMLDHHSKNAPKPTDLPSHVKRSMVEELTGEMVHWEEDLSVLKDYERDLMPWQVSPETQALADVCLVLMNSNEFLYVR
jgi:mono/diheme cytochrome c family protein